MAQEQTPKTSTPDSSLKDGKVRPQSKVKVLFTNSVHHGVPYAIEEVHPSLAKKLVDAGKAEMSQSGELTKEQEDANKQHLKEKAEERKSKSLTQAKPKAQKAKTEKEAVSEEDLVGGRE